MPPPGSVPEAVANAPPSAALAAPPSPAPEGAKRPRDPEAGPAALPKVPKQTAAKGQSDGFYWDKKAGKWIGQVSDPSQHLPNGKPKLLHTALFTDRAACAAARAALLAATRAGGGVGSNSITGERPPPCQRLRSRTVLPHSGPRRCGAPWNRLRSPPSRLRDSSR